MPEISVVILNWNGLGLLRRFLPSVVAHTPSPLAEVVMADNGSDDGSPEWVAAHYPQVRLVRLDRNYGFTGGYNRALAQLGSRYFFLLNSDVEVKEDYVTPLWRVLEDDPSVAAVMPKILSQREPMLFEYAGAAGGYVDRLGYPFCRGRVMGRVEPDTGQYDFPAEIFWASGAACLVRAELYRRYGGLDEDFFAHFEEIDLCWRLKNAGYRIMAEPAARVFHVGGATLDNASPRKLFLNFRNSLYMIYKNAAGNRLFGMLAGRMLFDGLAACSYLLRGKPAYFAAVVRAHCAFYRFLPRLREKRKGAGAPRRSAGRPAGVYGGLVAFGVGSFFKDLSDK